MILVTSWKLLQKVVSVSMKTVEVVSGLPELKSPFHNMAELQQLLEIYKAHRVIRPLIQLIPLGIGFCP